MSASNQCPPGRLLLSMIDRLLPDGEVVVGSSALERSCNRCPCRGRLSIGRLVARHGRKLPGPKLRQILDADCRRIQARERMTPVGAFPADVASAGAMRVTGFAPRHPPATGGYFQLRVAAAGCAPMEVSTVRSAPMSSVQLERFNF